jgi:PPOX class probable F420-dependent enzyme
MHLKDLPFQAMGGQSAFEPTDLEKFVAAARVAILAYTRKDGSPNQIPIWYEYEDGRFLMLTSTTSPKAKAIARSPRVCMTIQDDTPPYRAVIMDGEMKLETTEPNGPFHAALARRYFGRIGGSEYEKMVEQDNVQHGLTLMTFEPTRLRGFDNERLLATPLLAFMKLRHRLPIPNNWL